MRLVSAFAGGCLLLGGVVACSDAEAGPEPEDTPVVDTSVDVDGDAAADGDEDELGGDDVEEYEHPVPGPDFDDEGQAGAEAAAVYFVELYSYVYATADFGAWDAITTDECNFCAGVKDDVAQIYDADGWVTTDPPLLVGVSSQLDPEFDQAFVAEVEFVDQATAIYNAKGEITSEFPRADTMAWIRISSSSGDWKILGVEAGEPSQ